MARVKGLPGDLPPHELIVWQGAPDWRSLARRLCHLRAVALYLGIVVLGIAASSALEGDSAATVALTALPLLAAGALVLAFLAAMAWWMARTTTYTLTTHRLAITYGMALPATLAIPHAGIAHAAVTLDRDGTGDLPIRTKPGFEVAWRRTWPHARPWHFRRAQPMLRSVPQAGRVATLLATTLAEAALRAHQATTDAPQATPARSIPIPALAESRQTATA